ncbi:hypothetical protein DFJ73DRAFT_763457 [Zopfochytrium polystomum]|nr:hypothetical protein DFJ73DRAFT_763457 [Zopfochytrium polystomum]
MDAPILASSLRDFWSRRWNSLIKRYLHHFVFTPVIRRLEPSTATRPSRLTGAIATLAAFVASGVLHEYVMLVVFRAPFWTDLQQLAYFSVQGVLCVAERAAQDVWASQTKSWTSPGATRIRRAAEGVVGRAFLFVGLVGPGLLFMKQYLDCGKGVRAKMVPQGQSF